MATIETRTPARQTVFVDTFTDGLLGPDVPMLGPGRRRRPHRRQHHPGLLGADDHAVDPRRPRGLHAGGGRGRARRRRDRDPHPRHRGHLARHRVRQRPGDGGPLQRRPVLRAGVPGCGTEWPETRVEGIGPESVRCANCGADATPVHVHQRLHDRVRPDAHGRRHRRPARRPSASPHDAARMAALPDNSRQNPILLFAPHDIVGWPRGCGRSWASSARRRRRRCPTRTTPATSARSWSARRTASRSRAEELQRHKTDGHMDIDAVRPGAILVCPVKVDGGGVYLGDMHALQGDGEIAGHTCDVSGTVTLEVEVIKGLEHRRPDAVPGRRGPAVPRPPADRGGARARARARAPPRRRGARGDAADLRRRHRAGPQLGDRQRPRARGRVART